MAKKFYAQKDALGFPVPGTLQSTTLSRIPADTIEIPPVDVSGGEGQTVVPHPGKLRYFIRKNKKGNIIPNTLIVSLKKPAGDTFEFKLLKAS